MNQSLSFINNNNSLNILLSQIKFKLSILLIIKNFLLFNIPSLSEPPRFLYSMVHGQNRTQSSYNQRFSIQQMDFDEIENILALFSFSKHRVRIQVLLLDHFKYTYSTYGSFLCRCKARASSKAGEHQGKITVISAEHNHTLDEVRPFVAN